MDIKKVFDWWAGAPAFTPTAEYQAVLDKATALGYTLPSLTQQRRDDAAIISMKANGDWTEMDVFYCLYGEQQNFSTLNWKNPNAFQLVAHGTGAAFIRNYGWVFGSDGYLDTQYIPSVHGVNYKQNDSCFCIWTDPLAKIGSFHGANTATLATLLSIKATSGAVDGYNQATVASRFSGTLPTELHVHTQRTDSSTELTIVNGVNGTPRSAASQALMTASLKLGGRDNSGTVQDFDTTGSVRFSYTGSSGVSATNMYSVLNTIFNAVQDGSGASFPNWKTSYDFNSYSTARTSLHNSVSQTEDITSYPTGLSNLLNEGGVVSPAGYQYGCVTNSSTFTKILPKRNSAIQFGNISGSAARNVAGTLGADGNFYHPPLQNGTIVVHNPATDAITLRGSYAINGTLYTGAVRAYNDKIYCAPNKSGNILVIVTSDPTGASDYTFGSFSTASGQYAGMTVASDGIHLICSPLNAGNILIIDPRNDTFVTVGASVIGPLGGTDLFAGVVTAINGAHYFIPYGATTVLKLAVDLTTVTTFGSVAAGAQKYGSGCQGLNAIIYCAPQNADPILKINTANDTVSTLSSFGVGASKMIGINLLNDGRLGLIPFNSTNWVTIGLPFAFQLHENVVCSRFINKY